VSEHSRLFFLKSHSQTYNVLEPGWQGRALRNCLVGNFSEEPACRAM